MNLLAVALALLAVKVLAASPHWGTPRVLKGLLVQLARVGKNQRLLHSAVVPLVLTLIAVALVFAVQCIPKPDIVQVLFATVILFFCLGPKNLDQDLQQLFAARAQGDTATAERIARALQYGDGNNTRASNLIGALFIQSHERWFGVLLWFFALGPVGAVLYRVASRLPGLIDALIPQVAQAGGSAHLRAATLFHAALAWPTARLTALAFALAGSMDDALRAWRRLGEAHFAGSWRHHTWAVLAEVGTAALEVEDHNGAVAVPRDLIAASEEVLDMQKRALLLLLAVYAVFTTGTLL